MDMILTVEETRVLGCLIEKQLTTPDYYPMTLNALVAACNQKNNREPLTAYDEHAVGLALDDLREKRLAAMVTSAGARVPKFKHTFPELFGFDEKDVAVLTELFLRGPQTPGELRSRAGRLFEFQGIEIVQATLEGLMSRPNGPFVVKLPRQAGCKESRFAQLFNGPLDMDALVATEARPVVASASQDRLSRLEADVELLKSELLSLKQALGLVDAKPSPAAPENI